jgi:hypothetical protein
MRTGPLDPAAGTMDASVRVAARVIQQAGADMAGPFATLTAEMQLGLPLQLGGCGLPIPSPTLSAAARLSSAALTQAALQQGPAIRSTYRHHTKGRWQPTHRVEQTQRTINRAMLHTNETYPA